MDFEFLNDIGLSDSLKHAISDLDCTAKVSFLRNSRLYASGNCSRLRFKNDVYRLACAVKACEYTKKRYDEKGISNDIFLATMRDISLWCSENDNKGLKNYGWIKYHIAFELFRLGRLQFQICKTLVPFDKRFPTPPGEYYINVHIPKDGKLKTEECVKSFKAAVNFFESYFPEIKWNYFLCESWLVYPKNREFMDENSNIIKFSSLFESSYCVFYEGQTYERLFGCKTAPVLKSQIKKLPESSSLQKRAKAYRLSGGRFGIGVAAVKKQAFTEGS